MAIDEAIFRQYRKENVPPTIRFYGWLNSTVSLGYFQDIRKEVDLAACRAGGIDIVRRITGGKAVLHASDITYSVVASDRNPLFPPDIIGTYKVISTGIARGLYQLGIRVEMADQMRNLPGDVLKAACFASPSLYELLVEGRKICGSAQARAGGVFLQHGSLLVDFDPARTRALMLPHGEMKEQIATLRRSVTSLQECLGKTVPEDVLCHTLKRGFEEALGIQLVPGLLTDEEQRYACILMDKYESASWTMKGKWKNAELKDTDPG